MIKPLQGGGKPFQRERNGNRRNEMDDGQKRRLAGTMMITSGWELNLQGWVKLIFDMEYGHWEGKELVL
jgi:hypothetical protein